ncbi:MAG TPA: DUF677 domain-containing protein [Spirochaetia bacterium]|nr:DUF677 domain-containing protein [Spirochaetia bacterium]
MPKKKITTLDKASKKLTFWIGTTKSILIHTIFFVGIFFLILFGVAVDTVLLILTTAVSLEAIYLAIFIQMTVNRTTQSLESVEKDIDDIQEDVEDLGEDIGDIQEDVDSLEENVKGISDDFNEDEQEGDDVVKALKDIEKRLANLQDDIGVLKKKGLF